MSRSRSSPLLRRTRTGRQDEIEPSFCPVNPILSLLEWASGLPDRQFTAPSFSCSAGRIRLYAGMAIDRARMGGLIDQPRHGRFYPAG
jgi:hypothetical protein